MPVAGTGWSAGSAAGEQDVLEAALVVGEHDAPFAVTVAQGERAGVTGEDGAVAGDAAGVLVEPQRGGQPQPDLDDALPEAPGTTFGRVERPEISIRQVGDVGEVEDALLRR